MKTLILTDAEYDLLRHAVTVVNDIEEDTMFDNMNWLYPTSDEPIILTVGKASELRKELEAAIVRRSVRHSLCRKVEVDYNEVTGYSE